MRRKIRAIGDLIARDGDRKSGGEIIVDTVAGTVTLTAAEIYVSGGVLPVAAATLAGVPMVGAVHVGVRIVETYITEDDEPALFGLMPGTPSEGEAGAARAIVTLAWGFAGDGVEGGLYAVYLLKDGTPIDQTPPPNLTGINAQLAVYDFDANGNYVVIPTTNVVAQAYYNMNDAVIGVWTEIRFAYPVWLAGGVEYAFVVKTNDADHSISTAKIGDFDEATQTPVAGQPYSIGVMLSSSNAVTWTPHQDEDICFQLIGAVFDPLTKTVAVGTFTAANMSDLLIRAEVELPTAAANMHFEVELDDGTVTLLNPGQAWEMQSFYTGDVEVRAVLSGSAIVSPVVFPVILAIEGELQATGTYITRAFDMGTAAKILSYLKTRIPTGATIAMAVDAADSVWTDVPQVAQTPLQDAGWIERKYNVVDHDASPVGRVRIALAGTPAARPMAYDFRAISTP